MSTENSSNPMTLPAIVKAVFDCGCVVGVVESVPCARHRRKPCSVESLIARLRAEAAEARYRDVRAINSYVGHLVHHYDKHNRVTADLLDETVDFLTTLTENR